MPHFFTFFLLSSVRLIKVGGLILSKTKLKRVDKIIINIPFFVKNFQYLVKEILDDG